MADETYTGALANVYHVLGRIDGKLDSFDGRIRDLEAKEAGRAAREQLEGEGLVQLKTEVKSLVEGMDRHDDQADIRAAIRRYWYIVVIIGLPALLNIIDTAGDILNGTFGGN